MMNEAVSTIMSTNLITVTPDESLKNAHELLLMNRIHHLPVVEGQKLVGMITTNDFFTIGHELADFETKQVKDVMTKHLAKLHAEDKIGSVVMLFVENLFHAIPVVDEVGNAIGIVTNLDVLKYAIGQHYPTQEAMWIN